MTAGGAGRGEPGRDGGGEEVGGGEKAVLLGVRPTEYDEVALEGPLCSGDPDVSVLGVGSKRLHAQHGHHVGPHGQLGRPLGAFPLACPAP